MVDLKRITIPVFLIYAGVIHAIGLALLLPLIVTLPGPGSMIAPKGTPVAVELDAEADPDQTAALPAPAKPVEDKAPLQAPPEPAAPPPKADAKPDRPAALANASPTVPPAKPVLAAPRPKSQAKPAADNAGKAVEEEYGRATEHQACRSPLGQQGHQDRPVRRRHERAVHAGRAIQAEIAEKSSRRRCCAPP